MSAAAILRSALLNTAVDSGRNQPAPQAATRFHSALLQILLADASGGDALCCDRPGTIPSAAQSLDGFIRVLNYSRRTFPGHFICESDDSLPSFLPILSTD